MHTYYIDRESSSSSSPRHEASGRVYDVLCVEKCLRAWNRGRVSACSVGCVVCASVHMCVCVRIYPRPHASLGVNQPLLGRKIEKTFLIRGFLVARLSEGGAVYTNERRFSRFARVLPAILAFSLRE